MSQLLAGCLRLYALGSVLNPLVGTAACSHVDAVCCCMYGGCAGLAVVGCIADEYGCGCCMMCCGLGWGGTEDVGQPHCGGIVSCSLPRNRVFLFI